MTHKRIGVSLVLMALAFVACKKDEEPVPEPEPDFTCNYGVDVSELTSSTLTEEGLIPLSENYSWTYADTLRSGSGEVISTSFVTVEPIGTRTIDGDIWWRFSDLLSDIHIDGDSLYGLQTDLTSCKFKNRDYFPLGSDTLYSHALVGGDIMTSLTAYVMGETVSTPAGDFTNCNYYEVEAVKTTILKPGIGFIKISYPMSDGGIHEYTLSAYDVD